MLARVNPNGSGIFLDHPIGAAGAICTAPAPYRLPRAGGRCVQVISCVGEAQVMAAICERF